MDKFSKLKIAVLAGGPGAEREVSLKSGRMVMKGLDRKKYFPQLVIINKDGGWKIRSSLMNENKALEYIKNKFDLIFIALHGEYGEDGTLQKIFDKAKIRYTGSGARASRIGMDKPLSFRIFKRHKINVPDFSVFNDKEWRRNKKKILKKSIGDFGFPVVVKPADRGSSVGVGIIEKESELASAVQVALKYSNRVIIQKYIKGREFTCGVLGAGRGARVFAPTEIIPRKRKFFDYYSKYAAGATREITPPELSAAKIKKIQQFAERAHKIIGCSGVTRTDMIWGNDGKLYVLETNTLPGLTPTSLIPQAARVSSIGFSKLLDKIIKTALNK